MTNVGRENSAASHTSAPAHVPPHAQPSLANVKVLQADGWVVVMSRQSGVVRPKHTYEYERFDHLNDALGKYAELERDEFPGWVPCGIFPCRYGMPFGPELDAQTLAGMLKEVA